MYIRATILIGATITIFAVAAIVAAVAARDDPSPSHAIVIAGTQVSALERTPSRRRPSLPARRFTQAGVEVGSLRLARHVGTRTVYVAEGRTPQTACLVVEDVAEGSTATGCAGRSVLRTGAIYLATPSTDPGRMDVVALVADGVTTASGAEVVRNVAVIDGHVGRTLTLTNDGGASSAVDLGPQS